MSDRLFALCRRVPIFCLLAFLLAALAFPADLLAALRARSVMLIDMSNGRVLYEQNADAPIAPASLTKVLSMFVALDQVQAGKVKLTDTVRVSRNAARQGGSRMFLKRGDRVSLERLLYGMAVSSGNDASVAVAEHIAGSEKAFVRMMNNRMKNMGLQRSLFKNPHGLPAPGQRTTAREMAMLSYRYLKTYPQALKYHRTLGLRHNGVVTTNKNPLLRTFEGADGLKTGWVSASGYNLISTARRGNTRILAAMLGAATPEIRAQEINRLMEAGFAARAKGITVATALDEKGPVLAAKSQKSEKKDSVTRKKNSSRKKNADRKKSIERSKEPAQVARSRKNVEPRKKNTAARQSTAEPSKRTTAQSKDGWAQSGSLAPRSSAAKETKEPKG